MRIILLIVLLFSSCLTFAQTRNLKVVKAPVYNQTGEKRKAVVIGMSDYGDGRSLNNTLNDADDMVDVLTQLGFEVTLLTNNDLRNLETNLATWYNTIERNDMAIFYFAGHGVEVGGSNYLIPINAELSSEPDVRYNTLSVNRVLDNMDYRQVRFKLIILDACRDNPFTRGWSRSSSEKGLAHINAPKGMLIAFAAAPGAIAHDGGTYNLRNGVFTHFLKQELLTEGASIDNILNKVAGSVSKLTNDQQIPYKTGVITEDFYFKPKITDRPGDVLITDKPVEPIKPATPEKYYYYIDQNGNKSFNRFDDWETAESEMRNKRLYGKIYSNAGEVFVVEKQTEPIKLTEPVKKVMITKQDKPAPRSTIPGKNILGVGAGVGGTLYSFNDVYSGLRRRPTLSLNYENFIVDNLFDAKGAIGLGGIVAYSSARWHYNGSGDQYNGWRSKNIFVGARAAFHYAFIPKLDAYTGFMIGYNINSWQWTSDEYVYYVDPFEYGSNSFRWSWFAGLRFYFANNIAIFGEAGYGMSIFKTGISLKF